MTLKTLKQSFWNAGWPLLALRLLVGFGFAAHGLAKAERGVEHFTRTLGALGLPAPWLFAWTTTLVELLGGVALMAGALVTPLCAPLSIVMLTALFGVHFPYGFSSIKLRGIGPSGAEFGPPGYELNLLYLAALLVLAAGPPTRFSLDGWFAARRR